jgi:hypothetical protein
MGIIDTLVVPSFVAFVSPSQPVPLQIVGICVLDDILEFGGALADKYVPQALQLFLGFLLSPDNIVCQSASYGIAQAARRAPEQFAAFLPAVVPSLVAKLQSLDKANDDHIGTIENIVYCLALVYSNPAYCALDWGGHLPASVAALWRSYMPLRADETEAKVASELFCNSIERLDVNVIGPGFAHLTEVLRIIADCFISSAKAAKDPEDYALAFPSTLKRFESVVLQVKGSVQPVLVSASIQKLNAEQQSMLSGI